MDEFPFAGAAIQLLELSLCVGTAGPSFCGLCLVAKYQIELILVARTLPSGFGTLVAGRLGLITLYDDMISRPCN